MLRSNAVRFYATGRTMVLFFTGRTHFRCAKLNSYCSRAVFCALGESLYLSSRNKLYSLSRTLWSSAQTSAYVPSICGP